MNQLFRKTNHICNFTKLESDDNFHPIVDNYTVCSQSITWFGTNVRVFKRIVDDFVY